EKRGSAHLKGKEYVTGTTALSLQSEGHRMEGQTMVTIGGGSVRIGGVTLEERGDFAGLNRDVEHAQIVMVDEQTAALNGSITMDHRWFSEVGRQVIKDQHAEFGTNAQATMSGIGG